MKHGGVGPRLLSEVRNARLLHFFLGIQYSTGQRELFYLRLVFPRSKNPSGVGAQGSTHKNGMSQPHVCQCCTKQEHKGALPPRLFPFPRSSMHQFPRGYRKLSLSPTTCSLIFTFLSVTCPTTCLLPSTPHPLGGMAEPHPGVNPNTGGMFSSLTLFIYL